MNMKSIKDRLCSVLMGIATVIPTIGYADVDFAQKPLFAGGSVEANMLFILDDSGSMRWGFMPDDLVSGRRWLSDCEDKVYYDGTSYCAQDIDGWEALASPLFNSIYYNPDATYEPPIRADGTRYPDSNFNNAPVNGYDSSSSRVDLATGYRAIMDDYTVSPGGKAVHAFVYLPGPGCGSNVTTSCLERVNIPADQRQNFANWFSYYRTRMMASKAKVGEAFSGKVSEKFRLGWGAINSDSKKNVDGATVRAVRQGGCP